MLLCLVVSLEKPSLLQAFNDIFLYLSSILLYVLIFYLAFNKYLLSA